MTGEAKGTKQTGGAKGAKRGAKTVDLGWDELGVSLDEMFARSASSTGSLPGAAGDVLPLDAIDHNPYQARQAFSPGSLQELADSIREHGVIEPIIVRPCGERYEIVAGERRYRAALLAEQTHIPARVMPLDDTQAAIFTALENLQREDLDIEDEGRQFAFLQQLTGLSQRKLALKLGVERQYISRRIRLLKRPDLLQDYRSGLKTLHQVLANTGADVGSDGADASDAEDEAESGDGMGSAREMESGSAGPTLMARQPGEDADPGIELIEREDLNGYMVARRPLASRDGGSSPGSSTKGGVRFRWRPVQQFHNWVGRAQVLDVPPEERASLRAQLTEIKEALEKQITHLAQLDQLQAGSGGESGGAGDGSEQPAAPEGRLSAQLESDAGGSAEQ
ncbi:MAG: ParB/RepB/Spo0J family partition protein [Chloroflexota bacterium]